jgi:DNA topoisomerase-1
VTVRSGRFGSYLQLGEPTKDADDKPVKPKRASLPKGVAPDEIDLDRAVKLLSLPREVGIHPEDGQPIIAGVGRFGPYVKHDKTYANLEEGDDVLNVGLNRAVTLIAEKKLKPARGRRFGADPGRALGDHPQKGGPIVVKNGRYGPYVSHNGINATLPSDKTPETVTLDEAIGLLDARAERTGGAPSQRRRPARTKKARKEPTHKAAPKPAQKSAAKPKKRAAAAAAAPAPTTSKAARRAKSRAK